MTWLTEIAADSPKEHWRLVSDGSNEVSGGVVLIRNGLSFVSPDYTADPLLASESNACQLIASQSGYQFSSGLYRRTEIGDQSPDWWFHTATAFSIELVIRPNYTSLYIGGDILRSYYRSTSGGYPWYQQDRGCGLVYDIVPGENPDTLRYLWFWAADPTGGLKTVRLSALNPDIAKDQDCHVVATWDGSDIRLYINGDLKDTVACTAISRTPYTGSSTGPDSALYVSGTFNSGFSTSSQQTYSFCNAIYDDVVMYDTALSGTRIAAHYAASGITPPIEVDPVTLSAPIFLKTVPRVRLFAPIKLRTSESVTLSAPINLNTRAVALSAAISLQTKESVSLSAPINVVSLTSANTNRATGKWSVAVYVDGTDVSARLTGTIEIEQGEDISSLAFFTILPESGTVTPANYIGNRVRIDFIDIDTDDNVLYQLTRFVGFVSDPLYDPATGELYMQCTSDLQGTLDNAPRSYIDALTPTATWSPYVFDEGAQGWDYASDRMRTIPGSMWHGPSGIVITNWAAKTTADFEFTDDEMFECGPYAPGTRRDLLNTISASFDFRYKRKRQRTLGVKWETMQTFCSFLINGFTLCQRRMVESAASGAGWVLQGDIQYIDLPPAGYYTCFPFASGGQSSKVIGWGNLTLGQLNEDPDNQALCWGASWRAAKRWAQTVTEHYTIVISAAQSVAGNGEIGSIESYRLETSEDFDEWVKALDYSTADPVADGYEDVGGGQADGDYILGDVAKDVTDDTLTGRTAANTARAAIIASGTSDILSAHRQNQATLVVPFQPQVNPTHTVRAVSAHITFKGKIANMRDVWDIDTGDAVTEITVALSRHEGTGLVTPSPLTPEDPPEKTTEEGIPTTLRLLTYVGGRNDVAELTGDEQGYFTNWIYDPTETEPFATDPTNPDAIIYPEQFVVEYPEVSGGAVDAIELPATQNIDVEIPVDELTLTQ